MFLGETELCHKDFTDGDDEALACVTSLFFPRV